MRLKLPSRSNYMFFLAGALTGIKGFQLLASLKSNMTIRQHSNSQSSKLLDVKQVWPVVKPQQNQKDQDHNFLIVADGPFLPKAIIEEAMQNKTIIALDGAADHLMELGILPHVILGDFDSIKRPEKLGILRTFAELKDNESPYQGRYGITIVPSKNQDSTDLTKAIRYCDEQKAKTIDIVCATGGRMDHTLGNIRTLRAEHKENRKLLVHTETQTLQFVRKGTHIIKGEKKDYCGIMAFPHGVFSSQGLVYNVKHFKFDYGIIESNCNQLDTDVATIEVEEGDVLLIMPGIFTAQQIYNKKSSSEKLAGFFYESKRSVVFTNLALLTQTFGNDAKHIISQLKQDDQNSEVIVSTPNEDPFIKTLTMK